ncbi:MAG: immune inhibitor A [Candidatus Latescibacteria bacterium]|nr:immune inhibitor A [Candidatus Latescibacterota bacterium]
MLRLTRALLLILVVAGGLGAQELVCAGVGFSRSAAKLAPGSNVSLRQHRGQLHALAIFAKFADEAPAFRTAPEYASRLFDPAQVGSLSHFYRTMSSGQFELQGTTLPRRYSAERNASAFLPGQYGQFVREILETADAEVDFARFDNDGPDGLPDSGDDDGAVDYLFVVVMSTPRGFIAGEATGIVGLGFAEPYLTGDRSLGGASIRILADVDHGAFMREGTFAQTVGSMAHEFGHALGLPDLYDLNYANPEEDSGGVGRWCLMGWGAQGWKGDDGPNPFSAWCLKELGWIGADNERLVEVDADTALEAAAFFQGGSVYQIPLPFDVTDSFGTSQDYLLLEQRVRSGNYYDRHLPGEGLLVWHIRPQSNNNDERQKAVDLVCADGLYRDAGYPAGRHPEKGVGADNLDFWAHDEVYARAHQGNLGDATDPFDGVRFTRFEKRTNPSIDAAGLLPELAKGPGLRLGGQGERMRVEVEQLRWAGAIRREVNWAGQVLVDGDVQVAPEGRLIIHPQTQVRFAGNDRLRSGRDPARSELDILGELIIRAAAGTVRDRESTKVVFAAQHPGESWYGIVVRPVQLSRIVVPQDSYEMLGDLHGVLLPEAPIEVAGQMVKRVLIADGPGREAWGNGDGLLNPGEAFQCVIELDNWSLTTYYNMMAEIKWDSRLVFLPEDEGRRLLRSASSGLYPGTQLRLELPLLVLSSQAQPGQQLEFTLALRLKSDPSRRAPVVWQQEKVLFTVEGRTALSLQAGLGSAYPNPFNSSTLIRFQTALAGKVQLEIYDLLGQRVRVLAEGELPPGTHQRLWDGRDQRGLPVASGVYFCRLHTGGQFFSQRLLLLK